MEIERKFLVKKENLPRNLKQYPRKVIQQGYLCTDPVVRIRQSNDSYYLTYKSKGLLAREEYNLPLTKEAYEHRNCDFQDTLCDSGKEWPVYRTGYF